MVRLVGQVYLNAGLEGVLTMDRTSANFTLSNVDLLNDEEDDWGFTLFDADEKFVATFTYHGRDAALRGRNSFVLGLQDLVFMASDE